MGDWLFLFMRESHLLQTITADEYYERLKSVLHCTSVGGICCTSAILDDHVSFVFESFQISLQSSVMINGRAAVV
jgi:hypothetical protein